MKQSIGVIAGVLLVGSVWAQSAPMSQSFKPPVASEVPASDASAATQSASASGLSDAEKIARIENVGAEPTCEDAVYDKPQVHGSIRTTVVAGSHVSGSYNEGTVNVVKHYGGCDAPHGGVTVFVTAHVGKGDFHRDRR